MKNIKGSGFVPKFEDLTIMFFEKKSPLLAIKNNREIRYILGQKLDQKKNNIHTSSLEFCTC